MSHPPENQFAGEMNVIQDTVLEAITVCRDEIEELFASHTDEESQIDHTLKRLFAYQSDRSQTISFLVSANYWWDAEILMRSFYETHAKIWLICQAENNERQTLVDEFWIALGKVHSKQRADRAKPGADLLSKYGKREEADILNHLRDEKNFDFSTDNRAQRKRLEMKWSFFEILNVLEQKSGSSFPLFGVSALRHMYGQQSHLIHADESALDLMLDRRMRTVADLETLTCSHVCRILTDQVSLWTYSTSALRWRYQSKDDNSSKRWRLWRQVHTLTEPFSKRFGESQRNFYNK